MHWRGVVAALLTVSSALRTAHATLITITETASVCSASYTTRSGGSRSITVIKSTVTVSPVPWTDHDANSGTPFVLQIQPADGSSRKRDAVQPMWVTENGHTTTDGSKAAQYVIHHGALTTLSGVGYITTNEGVKHELFAISSDLGTIHKRFHVDQGYLSWANTEFEDGVARLYEVPGWQEDRSKVIAWFSGIVRDDWTRINVMARPVREAIGGGSSGSVSTTISAPSGGHGGHGGHHSHTRSKTRHPSGRPTPPGNSSPNGLCSGSTNYTCTGSTFGHCCSQYGFCGHGSDYCGAGCQPRFGKCWSIPGNSSTTSPAPSSTLAPLPSSNFKCPEDSGKRITDVDGIRYHIRCQKDTTGGAYRTVPVHGSFNDCFSLCDNDDHCAAFTYKGGANGIGAGVCSLKDRKEKFMKGGTDQSVVGAIRITPFEGSPTESSATVSLYTSTSGPIGPIHPHPHSHTRTHTRAHTRSHTGSRHSHFGNYSMTSTSAVPSGTAPVSPNGHCGTQGNGGTPAGYTCAGSVFGSCCSVSGFCGSTTDFCLAGCQSAYGSCTPQGGNPVTAMGECGPDWGNQTCTGGLFGPCCSTSGYCGSSADYCAPANCNPMYGTCSMSGSSMSTAMPTSTSAAAMSSMTSAASTNSLPACPSQSCGSQPPNGGTCTDQYGNAFILTCGTIYQGTIILRATKPNVGSCFTLCDTTTGCIAVNYVNGECQLLSQVTGSSQSGGQDAAGASRPAGASTVYTAPPSSTAPMMTTSSGSSSVRQMSPMSMGASSAPSPASVATSPRQTTSTMAQTSASTAVSSQSSSSSRTWTGSYTGPRTRSRSTSSSSAASSSNSLAQTSQSSAATSHSSSWTRTWTGSWTESYARSRTRSRSTLSSTAMSSSVGRSSSSSAMSSSNSAMSSSAAMPSSAAVFSSSTLSSSAMSSSTAAMLSSTSTSSSLMSIMTSSSSVASSTIVTSSSSTWTGYRSTSLASTTPPSSSYAQTSTRASVMSSTILASSTASTSSTPSQPTYIPPCPAANGTGYTDPAGNLYMVLCNTDTDPGAVDVSMQPDLASCIDSCSTLTGHTCVGITYYQTSCFYKSTYVDSKSGQGVEAAVLASVIGATPATYTPASSTARSTSSSISSSRAATTSSVTSAASSTATTRPNTTSSQGSSSSSGYLVLTSPTPCNFGDPPNTDEDDSYCEIDLPFAMQIYTQSDTHTYASTNGFISITSGSAMYASNSFPVSYLPNSTVAPFFDDLYLYGDSTPTQGIFYQLNTAQTKVTYEYYVSRAGDTSYPYHFTVAYDSTQPGIFVFTYYSTGGPGDNGYNCAVGSQGIGSSGTEQGVTYAYQSGQITPGLAVTCNTNQNTCVTTTPGGTRR